MRNKGFVVSSVLYPLLVLFLAVLMGLLSMNDTRKRILDKMRLEITDSIFDETTCSCDTILNKLNFLIKHGVSSNQEGLNLLIKNYETYSDFPKIDNVKNDIGIVSNINVTGYTISPDKPTLITEGAVWIHAKETSPNKIDTTSVSIPIAYVEQFQNGKWVSVIAGIWNGLSWQALNYTVKETATAENILSGKTAIVNGTKVTGTMKNLGDGWIWPNASQNGKMTLESYTYSNGTTVNDMIAAYPQAGYVTGKTKIVISDSSIVDLKKITANQIAKGQKVLGVSGTYTSDANAVASDIRSGKTAYVNGNRLTGTMKNTQKLGERTLVNGATPTTNQTIELGGYSGYNKYILSWSYAKDMTSTATSTMLYDLYYSTDKTNWTRVVSRNSGSGNWLRNMEGATYIHSGSTSTTYYFKAVNSTTRIEQVLIILVF